MSLVYGYEVKSYDDHLLAVARKMAELGGAVLPGSILVNELPFCKCLLLHAPRTTDSKNTISEIHPCVYPVAEL
jgi:hypothetical protein